LLGNEHIYRNIAIHYLARAIDQYHFYQNKAIFESQNCTIYHLKLKLSFLQVMF
jgi:hypothetical protein